MTRKTINEKNIRENLERDFYKNFAEKSITSKKYKMYKGLGLNWRDAVLFILAMFFWECIRFRHKPISTWMMLIQA